MSFAKKQLEKYGWKEGDGLGKDGTGIATAIKPSIKLNKFGLGHNQAIDFANWWTKSYNAAVENISVNKTSEGVSIDQIDKTIKTRHSRKSHYISYKKASCETDPVEIDETSIVVKELTDEELFAACGGRTAHKGARHGLYCEGKLKRVERQEAEILLTKTEKPAQKKGKKTKKYKSELLESEATVEIFVATEPKIEEEMNLISIKIKRKKPKNKSTAEAEEEIDVTVDSLIKKRNKKIKNSN